MREFGLGGGGSNLEDGGVVTQSAQQTMTPEEKAAAVEALKAKIAAKKAEKAKLAELDEIDKEKARREMGQKSAITLQERKEAQERLEAQKIKRQKEEEKAYLASLKEKVRLEREERMAKASGGSSAAAAAAAATSTSTEPASSSSPLPVKTSTKAPEEYDECVIQIRLTNGQQLKATFKPTQTIRDVVDHVSQHRTDGYASFHLMTNFPKVVFDSQEKLDMTLIDAKLVPRGVLVVTKA